MNCKFHPTAEAVTACAVCGAGMCSVCENGSFFYTEDNKPLCLECSLKEEEKNLEDYKWFQKDTLIKGSIASVIWGVGAWLISRGVTSSLLLMLVATIFFNGKILFTSDERGFFEKIKDIFWTIILTALLCPFSVILLLIQNKWRMIKSKSKIKKIKTALGKAA